MTPFFQHHLEIAKRETFGLIVGSVNDLRLPEGHYIFTEWYCEEPDCDCRRVRVHVHPYEDINDVRATISYGWESEEFYRAWGGPEIAEEMTGVNLELFGAQSRDAERFIEYFRTMVANDPRWRRRFVEHYVLFKNGLRVDGNDISTEGAAPMPQPQSRQARRAAERALRKLSHDAQP